MSEIRVMSALAQPVRLQVFRTLAAQSPAGMPAGELATSIGVAPSALSGHLAILSQAGLVTSWAEGRWRIYAARAAPVVDLIRFLDGVVGRSTGSAHGSS